MKLFAVLAVLVLALLAVADAQYRRPIPVRRPVFRPLQLPNRGERYAASLGGAPVGAYGNTRDFVNNRRGGYRSSSEVFGESLGNAKVGLYGNDRTGNTY